VNVPEEIMAKILLIEDNEMNSDMLSRRLIRRGHEITTASDAPAGIASATSTRPDLILMDISLPGMDGWEATKVLRSQAETASIPIIALTAHAMETDRQRSVEVGCNDFDTKPVDLARLLVKIDALLAPAT
jgi:two-component system, cell cycle response regulator DivK